jgi:hypothetical protein
MKVNNPIRTLIGNGILFVCLSATNSATAAIVRYDNNLNGFNAAVGNPPIVLDFDNIPANPNITGTTLAGIQFLRGDNGRGADLLVVNGNDTSTPSGFVEEDPPNPPIANPSQYKLIPTTGTNILSPGGTNLAPGEDNAIENDSLTLVFTNPITAFGFDLLSQSLDGDSFTFYRVFDEANTLLSSGKIFVPSNLPNNAFSPGAPSGSSFWGVVSDAVNIKRIEIDETDNNNVWPDSNIGFDTFRLSSNLPAPSVSIPEPGAVFGLGCLGAGALVLRILKKRGE